MSVSEALIEKLGVKEGKVVEIPDFDRVGLAALFFDLGYTVGVEVGTGLGLYSEALCQRNPDLTLYTVDPYLAYPGFKSVREQAGLDANLLSAKRRLSPYDARMIREASPQATRWFPDSTVDFVYVSANHEFSHVVADIAAWLPKIRPGGIMAGSHFIKHRNPKSKMHVVDAVFGFTAAYRIEPLFLVGTKEERRGWRRDDPRSWFWVNE